MADKIKLPENPNARNEEVDRYVDEAQTGSERKFARGRIGASRPKSPRTGVRSVDPESAVEGTEGEPSYGAPMDPPKVQPPSKRPEVKPDPLKKKD